MLQERPSNEGKEYGTNQEEESTSTKETGNDTRESNKEHWRDMLQIKRMYWLILIAPYPSFRYSRKWRLYPQNRSLRVHLVSLTH